MAGTVAYVDGLNFYYGAVKGTPHKWVDLELLVRALVPRDEVDAVRYFTANIKPQFPGDRAPERQNAYLRALASRPRIMIVKGHFRNDIRVRALATASFAADDLFLPPLGPNVTVEAMLDDALACSSRAVVLARVLTPEEKGSDVNLGCHLVRDALKGTCSKALVVTNDSDLAEPVRMAVEEGVEVGLVNPHRGPTNRRLRQVASFEIPFRRDVVAACQLPDPVVSRTGKKVHKPQEW